MKKQKIASRSATAVATVLLAAAPWLAAPSSARAQAAAATEPIGQSPLQTSQQQGRVPLGAPAPALGSSPADAAAATATPGEPQPLSSLAVVGSDYRINPNDLLEFDIFGVPDMKRSVRVNASGQVSLPLIGAVPLAGLTGQEAEALIAERYAEKYLQNPQVSLFIKEFTTQRVTVEGAVTKPGIYPVTGQLSLLRALALAGGFAPMAELSEITVYRVGADGQRQMQVYDLEKVRAGELMDPEVLPDDVIVVKRNPKRTAVRDSLFRDILGIFNPLSY